MILWRNLWFRFHNICRWLASYCLFWDVGSFWREVCGGLYGCPAHMPLVLTLSTPQLWPQGSHLPCCFALAVTSPPAGDQGLEQCIRQTPGPRALDFLKPCTLRSWQNFSPQGSTTPGTNASAEPLLSFHLARWEASVRDTPVINMETFSFSFMKMRQIREKPWTCTCKSSNGKRRPPQHKKQMPMLQSGGDPGLWS